MNPYVDNLREAFEKVANDEKAAKQKAYMRNQFNFFGLGAEEYNKLKKEFLLKHGTPPPTEIENVIQQMWHQPEREFQYFAMSLLEKHIKNTNKEIIHLIEYLIVNKSWWDTIDMIASKIAGDYFRKYNEEIPIYIEKWMASGNFWLQRTCLLFQLKYKSETDQKLLFSLIVKLSDENEFFIRKAIGWALREYSKTNPQAVLQFVASHQLKPLSQKEALKVVLRHK